jgi:putative transposase
VDKFQNKYRIQSIRLRNWDYGWDGVYFITLCTINRTCFFGNIINGKLAVSEIGLLAKKFWLKIPDHFSFVSLNAFCIMPNHIHGILTISKNEKTDKFRSNDNIVETRHCLVSTTSNLLNVTKSRGQLRYQNQGRNTLSSIIGSYKSVVSKNARNIQSCFKWQDRFYDHLIQDDDSFMRICHYIRNNPKNWKVDELYMNV